MFSNYICRLFRTNWKAFVGLGIAGLGKHFRVVPEWISQVSAEKLVYLKISSLALDFSIFENFDMKGIIINKRQRIVTLYNIIRISELVFWSLPT
jgi:hypothetical protein